MSRIYNKNIASLKTIVHDTSVLDAQKILLKPANGIANERANILDIINDSTSTINERLETVENEIIGTFTSDTFDTNTMNGTLDNATVTGIQYSKGHFINDARILSISIPFTAVSAVRNQGHLCIQVYDQSENIITTGYSNNKVSYNTSTITEAVYIFNEFYIPKDYKIIRLSLVSNTSVVPNITNNTNVLSFRARPIKFNNSFTFDDDECQTYNGTSTNNWLIGATISYNKGTVGVIQKFDTVQNNVSELENRIVELENKKIPTMTYDSINVVSTLTEQPTNIGELNAVIFNSAKIPHNIPIKSIEIPITGNTTSEALYLVAYNVGPDNVRSLIARSSNSIIPVSGINAIWQFEESFTILDGHSLAIYIAKENSVIGSSEVNLTDTHINCPQLGSGTDTIRYAASTYGRDVFVKIHTVNSIPLNDKIDDIISTSETHITKSEADNLYFSKENGINLTNVAKLDESNTFSKQTTFNNGVISNGDIILNGSRLLLANGAAVELYTGEELPTPEGGDGSHPLPNTGSCSYNEVKEHVEYHLQDDWSHLSFTERIVMDSIYRADIDNHISYYNSNRIDKVSSLQYTTANKIVLHTPYFLNGTLSVIQLQRDATAAVNCQLIASFYDKDDNLIISKVSINSWDYSQTGSVANFFFNAFDVPYNSTKLILEFTTDGSTPINDFIPIGYIVDSTTNGDTIVSPSGVMNYRVYITQFTPSPAITGLVPDTENILLDLAYGNMGNSGTNVNVGNITLAGTSTIVSPVTVTPISESGWLFGIVKFNEATSDAYITLNGIEIYRGDSLIGTSPFPLSLLLSPGDTFEASEKTQIENLRVYGCK